MAMAMMTTKTFQKKIDDKYNCKFLLVDDGNETVPVKAVRKLRCRSCGLVQEFQVRRLLAKEYECPKCRRNEALSRWDNQNDYWRAVKDYEGVYEVSRKGEVRTVPRLLRGRNGTLSFESSKRLVSNPGRRGYLRYVLSMNGKTKLRSAHRMVADAFIPNPHNLPQVNHIDENKTNNCVENLEWCSAEYNCNFGTRLERISEKHKIYTNIIAVDKSGQMFSFEDVNDFCRKTGANDSWARECLLKKTGTCRGYKLMIGVN